MMSILFRTLLVLGVLGLAYLLLFRLQVLLVQRLIGIVIGGVLCIFVVVPDLSTKLANFFGIGRGVDFLMYLTQIGWAYVVVRLYLRQQAFEAKLTTLTRILSLQTAQNPKQNKLSD